MIFYLAYMEDHTSKKLLVGKKSFSDTELKKSTYAHRAIKLILLCQATKTDANQHTLHQTTTVLASPITLQLLRLSFVFRHTSLLWMCVISWQTAFFV